MRPLARLAVAAAVLASACSTAQAVAPAAVPKGDYVISDTAGRIFVVVPLGRSVATKAIVPGGHGAAGIALGADRRTAYVSSLRGGGQPPRLDAVDLATGKRRPVASGLAPAVSPDGRRLAYLATEAAPNGGDYYVVTGLAIRDLASGATRVLASLPGKQPDGPLNWSPDGRTVAVYDGTRIRLVDLAAARDLASQPGVRGDTPNHAIPARTYPAQTTTTSGVTAAAPPAPTTATSRAPVFLDGRTLVAVYDCCIGESHLVAFDLATGKRSAFATLSGPPETIARAAPGRLLVVTAGHELVLVSRGRAQTLATGVTAAAG